MRCDDAAATFGFALQAGEFLVELGEVRRFQRGVPQVEDGLRTELPGAQVDRLDLDAASQKAASLCQ